MNKWLSLSISFVLFFFATGCWNHRELNDIAIVTAMGIDKLEGAKRYEVSFQVANPSTLAQATATNPATSILVYSAEGDTLHEATTNATLKVPRQLFFAHKRVIVIGESLAREGIKSFFDVIERDPEGRVSYQVLIAQGHPAKKFVSALSHLDRISGFDLDQKLGRTNNGNDENLRIEVNDVIDALSSPGKELVIPGVYIEGDEKKIASEDNVKEANPGIIGVKELAMFRKDQLIRWLDKRLYDAVTLVRNPVHNLTVVIDCDNEKNRISFPLERSKPELRITEKLGKLSIDVNVLIEGDIIESGCYTNLEDLKVIREIEQKVSKEVETNIKEVVQIAQEEKTDIFGFGEVLHRSHPDLWVKYKNKWSSSFSEALVKVKVQSAVRNAGLRTNPYQVDKE